MKIRSDKFIDASPGNKIGFLLSHAVKSEDVVEISKTIDWDKGLTDIDVHITANGVELDVEHFLNNLYDLMDKNIEDTASEMFHKVVSDKVSNIFESLQMLESKAEELSASLPWPWSTKEMNKEYIGQFIKEEYYGAAGITD